MATIYKVCTLTLKGNITNHASGKIHLKVLSGIHSLENVSDRLTLWGLWYFQCLFCCLTCYPMVSTLQMVLHCTCGAVVCIRIKHLKTQKFLSTYLRHKQTLESFHFWKTVKNLKLGSFDGKSVSLCAMFVLNEANQYCYVC